MIIFMVEHFTIGNRWFPLWFTYDKESARREMSFRQKERPDVQYRISEYKRIISGEAA